MQFDAAGPPQSAKRVPASRFVRIEHRLRFRIERSTVDERQTAA